MLMTSFDDALTIANFSFVYFLQFYLLNYFDIFKWGLNPPNSPLATLLIVAYVVAQRYGRGLAFDSSLGAAS